MDTIEAWMQEAVTSKHKGNTTRAWGDNQELLYVIKCLANLPNTSITQWCSLHQLPFCLTILTQCKPNNQNQTSKPRHQCCVIVCECALLLQKNLHLGLTKLFSLKVDGETFCCYLNNICTFFSNLAQNFGKPCCNIHTSVLKWALAMISIEADSICQSDLSKHMLNTGTLQCQCSDKLRRIMRSAVRCTRNIIII